MFVEWIIVGGLLFWLLAAVITFIMVVSMHNRNEGLAIFVMFISLLVWFLAGDLRTHMPSNPLDYLLAPVFYIIVGLVWAVPKWTLFLWSIKEEYISRLAEFKKKHNITTKGIPEEYQNKWKEGANYGWLQESGAFYRDGKLTPPQFSKNKERIVGYVFLWPWSMLESLIGDVLKRIVNWVIELCSSVFQSVSNWMFSDI